MTDISSDRSSSSNFWMSEANVRRVKARHAKDWRLRAYGLFAIALSVLLIGVFFASLIFSGYKSFTQTKIALTFNVDAPNRTPDAIGALPFRRIVSDAIEALAPANFTPRQKSDFADIFSSEVRFIVRDHIIKNPDLLGKTFTIKVPASDPFDQLHKGVIPQYVKSTGLEEEIAFQRFFVQRGLVTLRDGKALARVNLFIDPAKVSAADPASGQLGELLTDGLAAIIRGGPANFAGNVIDTTAATEALKAYVVANPSSIGTVLENFNLPLAPNFDKLARGEVPTVFNPRFKNEQQIEGFNQLVRSGAVSTPFNWELILNPNSRFPELAGLSGAIVGSFYTLLVCFLISFPVGIAAAVYLEEFAPKNRLTDLIEVNINNLAAVPSVVFGLLGLALFLNTFGLPRSAPLVGGMVLALITLPTIIVTTRAALKAVPPSIREAALGIGASKHQVVLHHVLPLALPGILTGTIIGLAHALGETAPLLLIGMNAFITADPGGILDPATALPTQIYSWADSPERGFVSRTSAAILVLLGFLVIMNLIAIILRQRFEKKW